jgi:capsular exopolysaccharide synthesis family protein
LASLDGRGSLPKVPRLLGGASRALAKPPVALISYEQPRSHISEAFRTLRTSLLLSQADRPPQIILVTSSLPAEGKTTAAVNLAVTLAQRGDRTLLIDADLRKPGISKALGLQEEKRSGLSSYLAGRAPLDSLTCPHRNLPNLALLPTGPIPPDPAELLSSQRLADAIATFRRVYKFIIFDSPPLLSVTDAVILSVLADSVVLVVRSGETPKEAFIRARDLLTGVNCKLLGVVLNGVDFSSPHYSYSYKYYHYSYGEDRSGESNA